MTEDSLPEIYNHMFPWGDPTDRSGEVPKTRIGGRLGSPTLPLSYLLAAVSVPETLAIAVPEILATP